MSRGDHQILKSVLLLLAASGLAFGVTFTLRELFPSLGVKVFNPLSDLFPTPGGEVAQGVDTPPEDPLLAEAMRRDSLERLESEATEEVTDTLQVDSVVMRTAAGLIPIGLTDYSGGTALTRLREILAAAGDQPVNVAFLGDSFIEGDILVEHFREALQARYGGGGVGYVPLTSVTARFRQTIKHRFSGSWVDDNALKHPRGSHFLITGSYQQSVGEAEVSYENRHPVDRATLLYSSEDSLLLSATVNGGTPTEVSLPPTGDNLRSVKMGGQVSSLRLDLPQSEGTRLYGVCMDGDKGVRVDNMSLRGSSGLQLGSVSPTLSSDLHSIRPYHLIVLAYGLNVVSPKDLHNDYGYYYKGMDRVLSRLHEIYPEAIFLILSISDRGQMYDGEVYTLPGVPRMVEVQERLAKRYHALFFNTYGTIRSMGGIRSFVSKGWAAKDYTHLSSAGGRELSKRLVQGLVETPIEQLTRQEAETPLEEALLPTQAVREEQTTITADTLKQDKNPTTQESTAEKDSI
ncbi:MAG: hypothetical protein SPI16_00130 [Porphyromonas sp.]|uniref:hypothetical protein n=1 Tax=Porphyromonas sp. TaxID=1924944 RepID=UPI002A910158|nr:hypothetical protein [Porphyromonas sp.]MDD7467987.1 hypothetical protein [Bacteroidales bacterium]MDY6101449.1 hypothetical protein [Porphyromonas sp.]